MAKDLNDFSEATKTKVFKRAGYQCSFPGCSLALIGPHSDSDGGGTVSTGEVSHISGARPAANNRYKSHLSPEQRCHHSNAIALCRTHAKLIDSDEDKYTVEVICTWKEEHEAKISKRQAGERFDEYYQKPYDKCSNEELFDDLNYRLGLVKEDSEQRTIKAFCMFGISALAAGVIYVVYLFLGGMHLYLLIAAIVLVVVPILAGFKVLEEKSEFIQRQEAAIKEANHRLKERGVI